MSTSSIASIRHGRRRRVRRRRTAVAGLAALLIALFLTGLCVGHTLYSPDDVLRVVLGERVPGASFTVGRLRLPRALTGALAGFAFGLAGATFQTLLRNLLASPDVIGITSGASAAAVFSIVVLGLSGTSVFLIAVPAGVAVALAIYLLTYRQGVLGARLVLVGIGVGALLNSVVSYLLLRAPAWDVQEAMRWLTGSLGSAFWDGVGPLAAGVLPLSAVLLALDRPLGALRLGDDSARALGTRVEASRLALVLCAVGLIALATAATGPIAFVAFLSAPIADRLTGGNGSPLLPAALTGAALVLAADLIGQFAFDTRFPVGVVTGALGAPCLLWFLVRSRRTRGAL
ncbi:FecCD family ABC transporter permease [Streptomyces nodosus]|uniref:ABC transporter permease n=1 Tax=Streptomyces nodosus TaxID=40318 RepID=A0A0B5DM11_9ACTN|nr:iron chelate uptake ABC transporter family permease subunit [Streptomyces nodosus]AJE44264.1 ABC transporter permease [Streptomyces nodosus]MBB4795886.1 iron complex transport system permease protein [Streptomyces nodosus]QEV42757.1 iron ABC transporter permease [Streptomyces nodosus]